MPVFISWVRKKINKQHKNALPNGILYLKGGDLTEEMRPVQTFHESHLISDNFSEAFFETKKVVYVQLYYHESILKSIKATFKEVTKNKKATCLGCFFIFLLVNILKIVWNLHLL